MSVKSFIGELWAGAKKHAPAIGTGFGVGLMLTGTVLAVKATPAAMEAIEEKKEEEGHERLTLMQTLQATWRYYIWAAAAELGGTVCIVEAMKEGEKRLGAALTAAEAGHNVLREFQDYRQFMREKIGSTKEAEVYNQAAQMTVNRNPPPTNMDREFIEGKAPKPVCYESTFGRYIYVDYDTVSAAVNKLNDEINNGLNGYASLNDFYDEIGCETVQCGDYLGWNQNTGLIQIPPREEIRFAGTPNGWPCWVLEFINPPQYEYQYFRKH